MSNAPRPACRLTIRNTGNDGRPSYEVRAGAELVERTNSQTRLRDLVREAHQRCAAEGLELEVDAPGLEALVAAWRARVKPPVGP